MKYTTHVYALKDKEVIEFTGPVIEADTREKANEFLARNGMGYLEVSGEYTGEKVAIMKYELN